MQAVAPSKQPQLLELDACFGKSWENPGDANHAGDVHPGAAGHWDGSPQNSLAGLATEIRQGFHRQEAMLRKLLDQQAEVLLMHGERLGETSNSLESLEVLPLACAGKVTFSSACEEQDEKFDKLQEDDADDSTYTRQDSQGSVRNTSLLAEEEQEKMRSLAQNRAKLAKTASTVPPAEQHLTGMARYRAMLRDLFNRTDVTLFIFVVIASNAAFVGVEMQVSNGVALSKVPEAFSIINYVYTAFFSIEVGLKLVAFGPYRFFMGPDRTWNIFDFFIVVSALLEATLGSEVAMGHLRVFRALRIVRIFRTIRMIRVLKFLSSLRNLLLSIMNTLRALVWTVLLVFLVFYAVGVALAQACSDYCREEAIEKTGHFDVVPGCEDESMEEFWGDLPTSMMTLFKSITGGVSWHDAIKPLSPVGGIWVFVFILYVGFMMFAVLNVVTGVFCQTAIESAAADKEMATMRQLQNRQLYVESIKKLFQEMDDDGSDEITIDEFEEKLADEGMVAFFDSIDVDTQDAWLLFTLIDKDKSGSVDLAEFVEGCLQLKGFAKAIHIAKLSADTRSLKHAVDAIERTVLDLVATKNKQSISYRNPPLELSCKA